MRKYEVIEQSLKAQMETGELSPGEKLPSESELCSRFGVSRNVVRQALRNLEYRGLTETIKGVGTFCRKPTQRDGLTGNIGFLGFFSHSYIFPRMIQGIDSVLYQEGFHLLVGQSLYDLDRERRVLESFLEKPVDGIILEPVCDGNPEYSNRELVRTIIASGVPVVFIDNVIPGIDTTRVTLDDFHTGTRAMEYLSSMGHRDIGLFYQEDYYTKLQRVSGCRSYVKNHPQLEINLRAGSFRGQRRGSNAPERAEAFLKRYGGEITAVFCSSDEDALVVMEAADRMGITVPQELSVIGFDDWDISSYVRIGLTTFEHPGRSMGKLIARSLVDEIRGNRQLASTSMVLKPRLVERTSVCRIGQVQDE